MRDAPFVLAVLCALVAASEWLARRGWFRHLGSALLVILLGAIVANLGLIPTASSADAPVAVYDIIFGYVAPVAIFWLLLGVSLREVLKAGLPLIALFLVGSLGTVAGAILGMRLVGGAETIGPLYEAVAGMFTGTYIGGSVNFNAIALHYEVVREGTLYGGSIVVDNIVTTLWMVVTLAIPRALIRVWPRPDGVAARGPAQPISVLEAEREPLDPLAVAVALALGIGALWGSLALTRLFARFGATVPTILIITTLALVLAQVPAVSRVRGPRALGMFAVYIFLAVIGAFCDLRALATLGTLGLALLGFALTTVAVHGAVIFGAARLFRMDLEGAAIASQANVGGSTSALALAKSLGREDLLLPGILLGAVGNAIGTFLGFVAVRLV